MQDPSTYASKLLAKPPTLEANFSRAQGAMKKDDTPRFVTVCGAFLAGVHLCQRKDRKIASSGSLPGSEEEAGWPKLLYVFHLKTQTIMISVPSK